MDGFYRWGMKPLTIVRTAEPMPTPKEIAALLDHTWLVVPPGTAVEPVVQQLCAEAQHHGFAAVCVRPQHVRLARQALGVSSPVALAVVVGFPEKKLTRADEVAYPVVGNVESTTKFQEICMAISEGAEELDVVMNVSFFKADLDSGHDFTRQELAGLRSAAGDVPIKLILETDLLQPDEVKQAVQWAVAAGMDTIKTSTGMLSDGQGATVETVGHIRQVLDELGVAGSVGIKASGGVRTLAQVLALQQAGATRIGTSNALAIMAECSDSFH